MCIQHDLLIGTLYLTTLMHRFCEGQRCGRGRDCGLFAVHAEQAEQLQLCGEGGVEGANGLASCPHPGDGGAVQEGPVGMCSSFYPVVSRGRVWSFRFRRPFFVIGFCCHTRCLCFQPFAILGCRETHFSILSLYGVSCALRKPRFCRVRGTTPSSIVRVGDVVQRDV